MVRTKKNSDLKKD